MSDPRNDTPEEVTERAVDQLEAGEVPGDIDVPKVLKAMASSMKPDQVVQESMNFYQEMFRIVLGTSEVAPDRKDWRFKDETWSKHPVYKRVAQSYLAWAKSLENLADSHDDWQTRERAKFGTDVLTTTLSPTNALLGNPEAVKRALETGGKSILDGMQHYVEDLVKNRGMPSQVDKSPFTVGENLAATPGEVVFRSDVLELLQYQATTPEVSQRPLLIIPPQIGKFYFLDLSPGRSLVEFAVSQGLQVFVISWRNPTAEQKDWNLDTYIAAILEATDVVRAICGTDDLNTMGFCAGGITMTAMLGYLAATGDTRVNAAAYAVTLLDFETEAMIGALRSKSVLEMAKQRSGSEGIIKGEDLGMLFTWMRPNDLVWSYWVNNYLMGKKPPSFDILAWNADSTNLPAALHGDFLDAFQNNAICKPGGKTILGQPIDISRITVDNFVTGGLTDHLTPWQGCYRTTELLAGNSTYVLSSSGHIASLVNPPGNPKSSYMVNGPLGPDPQAWADGAEKRQGSWWEYWAEWMRARSGDLVPAPVEPGNADYPPLAPAPGTYVHG